MLYNTARQDLVAFHQKYEALAALVIERGLQPEPQEPKPQPPIQTKEESALAAAIREESNGDSQLAQYFWRRAKTLRAEGQSDGDILTAIRTWDSTETVN